MNKEKKVQLVMIKDFDPPSSYTHWLQTIERHNLRKGWKTWCYLETWQNHGTYKGNIHPEKNKYFINFPIDCFKIYTGTVYPDE